jgi:hypothetical protein
MHAERCVRRNAREHVFVYRLRTISPMPARKAKYTWRFLAAAPVREVFAVTEQMIGIAPYRFEPTGPDSGRAIEAERKHWLFGFFSKKVRNPRWINVEAREIETGTEVVVTATRGKAPKSRGLQVVHLLTRGAHDRRTVYRDRTIPPGPITLVASWAGMAYPIYLEPRYEAPRGEAVHTASRMMAIGMHGSTWVKVRLESGAEGYIERDQVVPAPSEASRAAQVRTAVLG